jgi:hypothetical protein
MNCRDSPVSTLPMLTRGLVQVAVRQSRGQALTIYPWARAPLTATMHLVHSHLEGTHLVQHSGARGNLQRQQDEHRQHCARTNALSTRRSGVVETHGGPLTNMSEWVSGCEVEGFSASAPSHSEGRRKPA